MVKEKRRGGLPWGMPLSYDWIQSMGDSLCGISYLDGLFNSLVVFGFIASKRCCQCNVGVGLVFSIGKKWLSRYSPSPAGNGIAGCQSFRRIAIRTGRCDTR